MKRVDLIVRAMASVDPAIRLVVAGDGTQRENVEREAQALGVNGSRDVSRHRSATTTC